MNKAEPSAAPRLLRGLSLPLLALQERGKRPPFALGLAQGSGAPHQAGLISGRPYGTSPPSVLPSVNMVGGGRAAGACAAGPRPSWQEP